MEALQQSLAETLSSGSLGSSSSSGNVANYMGQMAMAMGKLGTLEGFIRQVNFIQFLVRIVSKVSLYLISMHTFTRVCKNVKNFSELSIKNYRPFSNCVEERDIFSKWQFCKCRDVSKQVGIVCSNLMFSFMLSNAKVTSFVIQKSSCFPFNFVSLFIIFTGFLWFLCPVRKLNTKSGRRILILSKQYVFKP